MKFFLFPAEPCERVYAYLGMRPASETEQLRRLFEELTTIEQHDLQDWKQAHDREWDRQMMAENNIKKTARPQTD